MEFTGERYVPSLRNAQINYEHWHRYVFARAFVAQKRVLDIACGEGYGSFYMADVAQNVTGIDNSSGAIAHASGTYVKENLSFIESDASAIAISENGVADVVVSFETIEHLEQDAQHRFLTEITRLLTPEGILLISTPDKHLYSDLPGYANEFHRSEFYKDGYMGFLKSYFTHVVFYSQRLFPVSLIWAEGVGAITPNFISSSGAQYQLEDVFVADAMYYIAVCSNGPLPHQPSSVLIDQNATFFDELTQAIISRDNQIQALQTELHALKTTVTPQPLP